MQSHCHSGNPNIAAYRGDVIEVVVRRSRHLHLEANASVAVAVLGIADSNIDVAAAAAVLDLNLIAVSALLRALDEDCIAVVAGHYHVARYVANSNLATRANPVCFLKILGSGGSGQRKTEQRRCNR